MGWVAAFLRWLADRIAPRAAPPAITIGDARVATPDDAAWDKAMSEYVLSIGTKNRAIASTWATSAAGLLAVLGAASILKGRETLDSIAEPARTQLAGLVIIALLASFATLFVAALAAQGTPSAQLLAPNTYRDAQFRAANDAIAKMRLSRGLVVVAFGAALAATALVLLAPPAESGGATLIVGGPNPPGYACGKLKVNGNVLVLDGNPLPSPALSYHSVKECPK